MDFDDFDVEELDSEVYNFFNELGLADEEISDFLKKILDVVDSTNLDELLSDIEDEIEFENEDGSSSEFLEELRRIAGE